MDNSLRYVNMFGRKVLEAEYVHDRDYDVHHYYAYLLNEDSSVVDFATREGMEKVEINKEEFHLLCRIFMYKTVKDESI